MHEGRILRLNYGVTAAEKDEREEKKAGRRQSGSDKRLSISALLQGMRLCVDLKSWEVVQVERA